MKQQWAHQDRATTSYRAGQSLLLLPTRDLLIRETTRLVRARNNAQRSVFEPAVVQVYPDGNHACHHVCWRLDVHYSSLHGPRTESVNLKTLADSYGQVLVPGDFPVGALSLIEEYSLHSKTVWAQDGANQFPNGVRFREFTNHRDGQEISLSVNALRHFFRKLLGCLFVETRINDGETVLLYIFRQFSERGHRK